MSKFKIRFVEGSAASSNSRTDFQGFPDSVKIEAESRVDAYMKVYRDFSQQGKDVTVIEHVDGQEHPLNFTKEELETIHAAGVPLELGYPKAGIQIEQIVTDDQA
jgi:translation initiation factor 1 (eIF-1/SUI1)